MIKNSEINSINRRGIRIFNDAAYHWNPPQSNGFY